MIYHRDSKPLPDKWLRATENDGEYLAGGNGPSCTFMNKFFTRIKLRESKELSCSLMTYIPMRQSNRSLSQARQSLGIPLYLTLVRLLRIIYLITSHLALVCNLLQDI